MTLQDRINVRKRERKMSETNDTPSLTDAELAARYAAEALNLGRYELGSALAHLAKQASRAAAQPRPTDLATAAAAQRDLFAAPDVEATSTTAITKSARCGFFASGQYCHGVIWWQEGNIGDAEQPAIVAGWKHMDAELDNYHEARPYAPNHATLGE